MVMGPTPSFSLDQLRDSVANMRRGQSVPQSGGPQPYYYGLPTPAGQPMQGSAPGRPLGSIWMQAARELAPGLSGLLSPYASAEPPPNILEDQLTQSVIGAASLAERGLARGKSGLIEKFIEQKQKEDPDYDPSVFAGFLSNELQQELKDRTQQRLNYGQRTVIPASLYSDDTKVLPFTNKSIGEALQDVALSTGPIDVAIPGAISKFGRPLSKTFGSAGTVLANSSKGYSYAAPTQALQKLGIDAVRGSLKAGQMIVEPISRSNNPLKRYLVEQSVDTAARTAFEYNPVLGIGGIAALPATKLGVRGAKNLYKKITAPTFDDILQGSRANIENILRPHRIEGTPEYQKKILEEQFRPTPSGAAVDEPKKSFEGFDTEVTMSGTSSDPRLLQGGEFYKYKAKIKLIDANDVATSHDPYSATFDALEPKDFPPERQNRDRFQDAADREKFRQEKILGFDPDKLMFDTGAMQTGLPIVSDGYVDAGNGRVIALKRLKIDYPEKYKEYLKVLRNSIEKYGIAPEQLDTFGVDEIPMLVRERTTQIPEDLIPSYVVDGNLPDVEGLSDLELADVIVEAWNENTLLRLIPTGKGIEDTLKAEGNAEIITELETVIGKHPNAKNWFSGGKLTTEGIKVFRQALYVKVFGRNNADYLIREIDILPKGEIKNVFNAVDEALPNLAVIKGQTIKAQKTGALSETGLEYDISDNLIQSMQTYRGLKDGGIKIADYLNQYTMEPDVGMQKQFIRLFNGISSLDKNVRASSKQIATVLEVYAKQVTERAGQFDMFSGTAPDKYALLEAAIDQTMPGVLPTRQLQLEVDQTQTKITSDNPNYDPDLDVSDELKLTDKEKKVVEKEVREEMNLEKDEPTPAYGEKKLESDKSAKNTVVSKDNIDQAEIGTKYDEQIPMSGEQRNVRNVDEVIESQATPELIKGNKRSEVEKDVVFPPGIAEQTFGLGAIETSLSPIQRKKNAMIGLLDYVGIDSSKYLIPESAIEGVFDQVNKTMNITNGIKTVLTNELGFRVKKVFKFRKDGVTIDYSSLKPGAPKIIFNTDPTNPLTNKVIEMERTFADTLAAYPEMKPFLSDEQIEVVKIWELKTRPLQQSLAEMLAADGRSFAEEIGKRQDIQEGGIYVSRGGAFDDTLDEPLRNSKSKYKGKPDYRGNAIFDSQAEGLYKGFEYDNIEDALAKFISQIGGEALDTHVRTALLNLTDAGGEKLAYTKAEALKKFRPDIADQIKTTEKKLGQLARKSKWFQDQANKHYEDLYNVNVDPEESAVGYAKKVKAIKDAGPTKGFSKEELIAATDAWERELIILKGRAEKISKSRAFLQEYSPLKGVRIKALEGVYFNKQDANSINQFYKTLQGEGLLGSEKLRDPIQALRLITSVHLMTTSTLDNSALMIQGQYALFDNPKIWGKALKSNMSTVMDPDELTKVFMEADKLAQETGGFTVQELVVGGLNLEASEFTSIARSSNKLNQSVNVGKIEENLTRMAEKINKNAVSRGATAPIRWTGKTIKLGASTANRMFDTFLKRVRVEVALDRTQYYAKAGYSKEEITKRFLPEITDLANNMTGTGFIDRRYRNAVDISRILFYAPRYLWYSTKFFARAIRGSVPVGNRSFQQKAAAAMFWKQLGWMTMMTVMINDLQGYDTDFRPVIKQKDGSIRFNSNFVRLRVGNQDYSLLGLAAKPAALFWNTFDSLRRGKPIEAGADFLRVKGSGIYRMVFDTALNREWDGTPIYDKNDTKAKIALDTALYMADQFQPFTIQGLPDDFRQNNIGTIPLNLLLNTTGISGAETSYTDKLIERARTDGLDYTRLEPHQKRAYDKKLKDEEVNWDDGAWRNIAGLFNYVSPERKNAYDAADAIRLNQEDESYRFYKAGKDDNGNRYDGYNFIVDMLNSKNDYYKRKHGIEIERDIIYEHDQSVEEKEENVEAYNSWFELYEIYTDPETERVDEKIFEVQEKILKGEEVIIKDQNGDNLMVGGWNKDQIAYINRNTILLYHRPEIVTAVIRESKRNNKGKFWVQNIQRSMKAREEFEKAGSPGSALDPNATFLIDERNFGIITPGGRIQSKLENLGADLSFIDYLNRNQETDTTEPPTFQQPTPTPTPGRRMRGSAGQFTYR